MMQTRQLVVAIILPAVGLLLIIAHATTLKAEKPSEASGIETHSYAPIPAKTPASCCNTDGIRGDVDMNGSIDVADLAYFVSWAFIFGAPPSCLEEADANGDGNVDICDLTDLINYLFWMGPVPAPCPPSR